MDGDARTAAPVAVLHNTAPVTPDKHVTVASSEPTTTSPAAVIAGLESTTSPDTNDQTSAPVAPSSAYTLVSPLPTTTTPDKPTAGELFT